MDETNFGTPEEEVKQDPFSEILENETQTDLEASETVSEGEQVVNGDSSVQQEELSSEASETVSEGESGFSDLQLQQLQELLSSSDSETISSVSISVDDMAILLKAQTVELCSTLLFCAMLVSGTIAAIKLWGGHWSGS